MAQRLEEEMKQLRQAQAEIEKSATARAHLIAQMKENELVQQELSLLDDEARIFKLIGPVMVKQEKKEAAANVSKRLDFLQKELKKLESNLEELQKKQNEKRKFIAAMQAKMYQQHQQQQPGVVQ